MSKIFESLTRAAHEFARNVDVDNDVKYLKYRHKLNELIVEEVISLANWRKVISVADVKKHFDM